MQIRSGELVSNAGILPLGPTVLPLNTFGGLSPLSYESLAMAAYKRSDLIRNNVLAMGMPLVASEGDFMLIALDIQGISADAKNTEIDLPEQLLRNLVNELTSLLILCLEDEDPDMYNRFINEVTRGFVAICTPMKDAYRVWTPIKEAATTQMQENFANR